MGKKEPLIKELKKFLKSLSKDFLISNIILFGSRSTKKFNEFSDVDLIIVSRDFAKLDFFERVKKMYNYWNIDLPVDFICYTPEEFNKLRNEVSIVRDALSNGIVVK